LPIAKASQVSSLDAMLDKFYGIDKNFNKNLQLTHVRMKAGKKVAKKEKEIW
jgi:hypothetical protein